MFLELAYLPNQRLPFRNSVPLRWLSRTMAQPLDRLRHNSVSSDATGGAPARTMRGHLPTQARDTARTLQQTLAAPFRIIPARSKDRSRCMVRETLVYLVGP